MASQHGAHRFGALQRQLVIVRYAADPIGVAGHLNLHGLSSADLGEQRIEGWQLRGGDFDAIGFEVERETDRLGRLSGERVGESAVGIFGDDGFRLDVALGIDGGGAIRLVENCRLIARADCNGARRAAFFRQQHDKGIDGRAAGKEKTAS